MSKRDVSENVMKAIIDKNEAAYGKEIRQKYGDEAMNSSNANLERMGKQQWNQAELLSQQINEALKEAYAAGDPASELAQRACHMHRQWISMFWEEGAYSKAAHKALAESYVSDDRFKAYYDAIAPDCAEFLRDAIDIYCGE